MVRLATIQTNQTRVVSHAEILKDDFVAMLLLEGTFHAIVVRGQRCSFIVWRQVSEHANDGESFSAILAYPKLRRVLRRQRGSVEGCTSVPRTRGSMGATAGGTP